MMEIPGIGYLRLPTILLCGIHMAFSTFCSSLNLILVYRGGADGIDRGPWAGPCPRPSFSGIRLFASKLGGQSCTLPLMIVIPFPHYSNFPITSFRKEKTCHRIYPPPRAERFSGLRLIDASVAIPYRTPCCRPYYIVYNG